MNKTNTHIKAKHPNKTMKEDYRGANAGKPELKLANRMLTKTLKK